MAEEDKKKKKPHKPVVIELDLSQMQGVVNEAIESLISQGKLVRDEETGDIIDPVDTEKVAATIEKNKARQAYKAKSARGGKQVAQCATLSGDNDHGRKVSTDTAPPSTNVFGKRKKGAHEEKSEKK